MADFAPHNMTTNTAPSPYVASASTEFSASFLAFKAFDGSIGVAQYWIGKGSIAGDFAPHNMTSASAPSPYVASASTEFSATFAAWKAFDGLGGSGSYWVSTAAAAWLKLDIGSGNSQICVSYGVRVNSIPEATRCPKDWTLEGSNDNSAWDTLDTVTAQTSWASGSTRVFQCDVATMAYRYFRLNITANNGDSLTQVAELYLSTVSASVAGAGVDWLKLDIGSGNSKVLSNYNVQVNSIGEPTIAPNAWTMEGSNDDSSWDVLDTVTGQTSWSTSQSRNFVVDVATTAYRYFRLNITANNGGQSVQVAELFLFDITISVSDTVTVTESVTEVIPQLFLSVFDAVTLTEATFFPAQVLPNVNDAITVTESTTALVLYPPLLISVFENVVVLTPDIVALSLTRTISGNALIIGGVTYLFDENSPANISKRTSDAWSASFSIVYTSGSKPESNQEVEFFWASVKRFGGVVQSISETRIMGPTDRTRIVISCTGYQSLLNRAIVAKLYTLAISGWPIMIFDIWFRHLQDFGITLAYPQGPLTGFAPHLFHYRTVAECFNVCRDENAGVDYWITDQKALVFANFGAGGPAPFMLRNGDFNQSSITVTTSAKKFRNKQWVLPSVPLNSLLEEPPVTTTANQIVFETQYAQTVAPVVTLDTVEQDVTTLGNWDGAPWYYIPGGIGVFRSPGAPAITGGQTVTITYPNPFPLAYSAQDDASIADVGLYESIYQAKNIVDQPTAEAFAAALLEAYGTDGLFPESIRFTYNSCNASGWTGQTEWLLPGMVVDVDRTFPNALGDYVVEEVSSQLECFTIWRHSVTMRLGKGDVSESFEADFLRGTRLWVNDPPIRVTIELDLTGAGNVTGVQPQFYTFMGQGIIASWDAQFNNGYEPTGEDFIIDLLYDPTGTGSGTSIFPSGDANKIVVPDGSTAQAGGFVFTSNNLPYTDAAKLTMNIIQAAGTKYGVIHLNLKPNTALPPA